MSSRRFLFQLPAGLLICWLGQACITTPASETGWSGRARQAEPGSCGAAAADAMIEDAEDGDTRVLQRQGRGGYWFSFVDSSGSTIEATQGSAQMPGPGRDSKHAARMTGRTAASGESIYAGMGLSLAEPRGKYDASRYNGISFWAKGPAHVRLEIPDGYTAPEGRKCKDCYNDFGIELALAAGWNRYTVPFEWLSQRQGWGDPRAEIERSELFAIEWQFGTPARDFDVWIDDVTFTCEAAR
jgi:endoglucanase